MRTVSPCPIVPAGSVGKRPVHAIDGFTAALETAKPSAMSCAMSCAMLPIQRQLVSAGSYVPCWNTVGAVLGERSSYQRTPLVVPATIEGFKKSASCVPKLRYVKRNMRRSSRPASSWPVGNDGMQLPVALAAHVGVNAATVTAVGPVSVLFA